MITQAQSDKVKGAKKHCSHTSVHNFPLLRLWLNFAVYLTRKQGKSNTFQITEKMSNRDRQNDSSRESAINHNRLYILLQNCILDN